MPKSFGIVVISVFYILSIIAFLNSLQVQFALVLLIILAIAIFKRTLTKPFALFLYLVFILGFISCDLRIKDTDIFANVAPNEVTISGMISSIPTTNKEDRTKFFFNINSIEKYEINSKTKTVVTINDKTKKFSSLKIGDEVKLYGRVRLPMKATNPSQFDYSNYLKNNGVFTTFYVGDGGWTLISEPKSFGWKSLQALSDCRSRVIAIHSKYIQSPNLEVLGGMIFGDDAINPPEYIKDSFINSGLLHILAASGLNVALIFGIWFFISQKLRMNYRLSLIIGIILIVFYTCMTGFGASILRASLMLIFILLGKLIDRQANSIALLFFVALLLLLYSPNMLTQVGFQLSFVVTFGLLLMANKLIESIDLKYFPNVLKGAIIIPFVAQIFVAPIQMYYFNTFATYSIFANILSLPFLTVISFGGFTSSLLAIVPPFSFYSDKICMVFDFLLNPFLSAIIFISDFFAKLPYSLITTFKPDLIQIILYYASTIVAWLCFVFEDKRKQLAVILLILITLLGSTFIRIPKQSLEVIFFDVKNADSFLIKSPDNKYYLIDTARDSYQGGISQANAIIGKYLKDNNIKNIEVLILTHFDSDHAGGAIDILKQFKVKKVIVNSQAGDTLTSKEILKYLKDNHFNYKIAVNNEILADEKDFVMKTFIKTDKKKTDDDNEKSIVTLLTYKDFDVLFMADASATLVNHFKMNLPKEIEVLKVAHHGAKNSVNQEFLDTVNPKTAIISVGYNSYLHPDKETIKILHKNNVKILRTDIHNAVKVKSDGKSFDRFTFDVRKKDFIPNY